uniref:Uncharacterized protein n=1 Tax=Anguilla anguilla TaxID=7936 RepID=A0A0E9TA21_ANGAN
MTNLLYKRAFVDFFPKWV